MPRADTGNEGNNCYHAVVLDDTDTNKSDYELLQLSKARAVRVVCFKRVPPARSVLRDAVEEQVRWEPRNFN